MTMYDASNQGGIGFVARTHSQFSTRPSQRAREEKSSAHLSGTETLTVSYTRELEFPSKLTRRAEVTCSTVYLVRCVDPRLSPRNHLSDFAGRKAGRRDDNDPCGGDEFDER